MQSAYAVDVFKVENKFADYYACDAIMSENIFKVTNTGTVTRTINTELSGAPKWSLVIPSKMTLAPGEVGYVTNYIKPPFGEGVFEQSARFTSGSTTRTLTQNIHVVRCPNYKLLYKEETPPSCPGETAKFKFKIFNNDIYSETFKINVTPFTDYFSISEEVFDLGRSEEKEITLTSNLPYEVYGKQDFEVLIHTKKNNHIDRYTIQREIKECFDYDFKIPEADDEIKVCTKYPTQYTLQIENEDIVPNNYNISLEGIDFAELDNNSIHLKSMDNQELKIGFEPINSQGETYNLRVNVDSQYGNIHKTKEYTINVEDCFPVGIEVQNEQLIGCQCEKAKIPIKITNLNSKRKIVELELAEDIGLDAELDEERLVLYKGDTETATLTIENTCELRGKHQIPIRIYDSKQEDIGEDIVLDIDFVQQKQCYDVQIEPLDPIKSKYGEDYIKFTARNEGYKDIHIDMATIGSSWISLDQTAMDIKAGEEQQFFVKTTAAYDIPPGKYKFSLKANSAKGELFLEDFIIKLSKPITDIILDFLAKQFIDLIIAIGILAFCTAMIMFYKKKLSKDEDEPKKPTRKLIKRADNKYDMMHELRKFHNETKVDTEHLEAPLIDETQDNTLNYETEPLEQDTQVNEEIDAISSELKEMKKEKEAKSPKPDPRQTNTQKRATHQKQTNQQLTKRAEETEKADNTHRKTKDIQTQINGEKVEEKKKPRTKKIKKAKKFSSKDIIQYFKENDTQEPTQKKKIKILRKKKKKD